MSPRPPRAPAPPAALVATALVAAGLGLGACDGNITCVFTTGCQDTPGGGIAGQPATLPEQGEWIRDERPRVTGTFPTGSGNPGSTPIVITFGESMSAASLQGAIEIVLDTGGGLPGPPLPNVPQALIGDGRVLVLLPQMLVAGDYDVGLASDAVVTDLTGQRLDGVTSPLASFTVTGTPAAQPAVLATWPPSGAVDQSDLTEVVVVFDRPVDAATVDDTSFLVTVDGAAPPDDPEAMPLSVLGIQEERVYLYQSADPLGTPVRLGSGVPVQVELSPVGAPIEDDDGDDLARTTFSFTTAPFATPLSAAILSQPSDGIGTQNLTAGGPEELLIQVDLDDAQAGDVLDLFLFGTNLDEDEPQLIAVRREIVLAGMNPVTTASYTLADVDLLLTAAPLQPRFAEGPLSFAFRLRRGTIVSPLRVLDVDPGASGIQDPVLDTTGPTIDSFFFDVTGSRDLASDVRDVVLSGRASEALRSVEVRIFDAAMMEIGNNGTLPPAVGTDDDGLFVAAPVMLGALAPDTVAFTAIAYDLGGNPSPPVSGTFRQLGRVGPQAFTPGDDVTVQVFDARTFQLLAGAHVATHSEVDDGVNPPTYPLVAFGTTDTAGTATVASAGGPNVTATLLTVELPGYDLFTFHGVPATRLEIGLDVSGGSGAANAAGRVTTTSTLATISLPDMQRRLGDTRRSEAQEPTYADDGCFTDPFFQTFQCTYGPEPILPSRLGAQTYLAGFFDQTVFSAPALLQAFDLRLVPPTAPGTQSRTDLELPFLLSESGAPPEEAPVTLPMVTLDASATTGFALLMLDDDPATTGEPRITVEGLVPGVRRGVPLSIGIALDLGIVSWTVRTVAPGAATAAGFYGMNGTVDPDFFLRAEIRDLLGNRAGQRPRLSELPNLPSPNTLFPGSVPRLLSPLGAVVGPSYDLTFDNTIIELQQQPGLYRVRLSDSGERSWNVWTLDEPNTGQNAPPIRVHLPDLSGVPGADPTPLANGAVGVVRSSWAWPGFTGSDFLWTDVEREHDVFSHSAPTTITQNP